jgi:hypothetical protein
MRRYIFSICTTCGLLACAPAESKVADKSANQVKLETDSIPVIILRSYFNSNENISLSQLQDGLNSGRIACTADVQTKLKTKMRLSDSLKTTTLRDFPLADTSLYLVTSIDSVTPSLLMTSLNEVHFLRDRNHYPLWIPDNSKRDWQKAITSYTHTGVTALTRRTGSVLNTMGTQKYLELIQPVLGNPEILHVSNEVSMQPSCDYASMKMKFATSKEHFEILNLLGADVVELTGNHNLDVGADPYVASMQWYKDHGMKTFGGGLSPEEAAAPLIMTLKDGKKIAWIGFNEFCPCGECADTKMGANRYDDSKASAAIKALRSDVDYILACVQFGETDSYTPSPTQKRISKFLIDSGVDVVIGSQAHQPQTFEFYHGKMIFYGIGNFMFDQIHRLGVRQAYFLECYIYNGKIIQFIPQFTYMGDDRRPAPASAEQAHIIKKSVYLPGFFQGK